MGDQVCATASLHRIELVLHGLRTVPGDNAREHWAVKAARAKEHRLLVAAALRMTECARLDRTHGLRVTFIRRGPRRLDDDNLAGSFKHLRDGIAAVFGVDDGKPFWAWVYRQEKGKHGAEIVIESREEGV